MRLSRFTIMLDMEGYGALFNGVTGCMDLVSSSFLQFLDALSGQSSGARRDDAPSPGWELLSIMKLRGHITEADEMEELHQFRRYAALLDRQNRWLDRQTAYIMLLLSYYCNLDCTYCFQKDFRKTLEHARLRPRDVDLIFERHLEHLCPGVQADKIYYTLYGGEPLLMHNMDAIERVLQKAGDRGSPVHAISNGYYLDSFLHLLGQAPGKISNLQMSFSCDKSVHDAVRVLKGGRPTFMRMLDNAEKAMETGVSLVIRVHMHHDGEESFRSFLSLLEQRRILGADNVTVHAARTKNCSDALEAEHHYERSVGSEELMRLAPAVSSLESCYYHDLQRLAEAQTGRGPAKTVGCMRGKQNCYVLDPFGDIYACYEEAGTRKYTIGTYSDQHVSFLPFRKEVLAGTIGNQNAQHISPISLITGGGCNGPSLRRDLSRHHVSRDDLTRAIVETALKQVIRDTEPRLPAIGNTFDHMPINFPNDGNRSIPALIDRFTDLMNEAGM
ncbi:MAG: radical SAM protein [Desulfomonilaceae bacterium]|nr:radical SAM protein [Desulfomonilaceae bacterium]